MQEKNKLLFCTDSPGFGGAEKSLFRVITFLKHDYEIELVINKAASKELFEFIKTNNLPFQFLKTGNGWADFLSSFFAACKLLLNKSNYRFVIWCHHLDTYRWLQFALAVFRKKFFVIERLIPSKLFDLNNSKLTIPLKKFVCSRSLGNILCAYSQVENYRNFFDANNITVIPNSRNINQIRKVVANYKQTFQPTVALKGICITSIGRLAEQKDPLTIINAVHALKHKYSVSLVLVGDGELMPVLQQQIKKLKMDNVFLIGHDEKPLRWLAYTDIFILNSLYEGLPGALIEAMAAGVPCIATDIPGNRELVIDKETGLLISINNAQALADSISYLIEHPVERKLYAQRAYEHVLNNYDLAIEKEKWLQLFNKNK